MSDSAEPSCSSPIDKKKWQPFEEKDDSNESFTSYSDEFLQFTPAMKLYPCLSSTFKPFSQEADPGTHETSSKTILNSTLDGTQNISVWEKWLVSKLQLDKEKSEQKKKQARIEKEEKQRKQEEAKEKKLRAQERQQEWLEQKMLKMKLQREREKREQKVKEEIENEKAAEITAKAKVCYQKWLENQRELERERKLKEKEKQEKEEQLKEEQSKKAEKKYQEWLERSKERFAALRNKGPPTPSYVNPRPWVGPEEDETRRRPSDSRPHPSGQRRPLARSQSLPQKRCSTPKPRSRGLETHTPFRMGRSCDPRQSSSAALVRVHTPLRFSGYRPKVESSRHKHTEASKSLSKSRSIAPRPFASMHDSDRFSSRNCIR